MNNELKEILSQLEDSYKGDPWYGRNILSVLKEIDPAKVCEKPNTQSHSMLQLLYHMITWRSFVISRIENDRSKPLSYFENKDWEYLNDGDQSLWQQGLDHFDAAQKTLVSLVTNMDEKMLDEIVFEREYNFRKLLYGVIQHDIYHSGQLNYIHKLLA
jgi:uncharacterized damage-inducible protein DinB